MLHLIPRVSKYTFQLLIFLSCFFCFFVFAFLYVRYIDEDGEALMDPDDLPSDREASPYTGNQIDDESGDEWRRERSPTPTYDEDKVGKPRKRLIKKGAKDSSPEHSGSPAGQAFGGEDLDDWEEEEPVRKKKSFSEKMGNDSSSKKERRKVLQKPGRSSGKASSSGSKGYGVGSADHESDPEVQELWDTIARDDSEVPFFFPQCV